MKRWMCCLGMVACLGLGTAAGVDEAAKRPNYTGRWKMIKDQSDFGKFARPDIIVRVVDERDPTMNIHTIQTTGKKTATSDVSYFIDGRESTNLLSGRSATSKAFWDSNVLVIRTETKNSNEQATEIVDRWELSPNGEMLTIASHIETTAGTADLKLVCEKESEPAK